MMICIPLLLSLCFGLFIARCKNEADEKISNIALLGSILMSISLFGAITLCYDSNVTLFQLTDKLSISLNLDGLALVFASLVAVLWPIATFYAKTYMTHDGGFRSFFTFYTLTYGVVLGLALSANLLTLYLFYELLTFITLPLVTHNGKSRDKYAGKQYILYMIFGASLSFAGMAVFITQVGRLDFVLGGIVNAMTPNLLIAYVLMFVGFAVKAGMFPFHGWLIGAGVAPTTVTALLHAVAVVKSGAFAVMRVTYCLYDPALLRGTWAHITVLSAVTISVVFGSYMATRSRHLKRRLAFSTVSQLSYILLGVATMSYFGLAAALLHMVFHACMKIVLFYDSGNMIFTNHVEMVDDLRGYGKKMPITCLTFVICGLALFGLPPMGGFFSKFALGQSALAIGGLSGGLAVSALILSAFFTAIYVLQVILICYLPNGDFVVDTHVHEAPRPMTGTVIGLTVLMLVLSLCSGYLYNGILLLLQGVM